MTEEQIKKLTEKLESQVGVQKKFDDTLTEIKKEFAEQGVIPQLKKAVEELCAKHKAAMEDVTVRLAAIKRDVVPDNGIYRGMFGKPQTARAVALLAIMLTCLDAQMTARAADILKTDHKSVIETKAGTPHPGEAGLVPTIISDRVQFLVESSSAYASLAFKMPMTSDSLSFTRSKQSMRARKTKYRTTPTQQQANWSGINLQAEPYTILTSYPISLEEDALIPIGDMIGQDMGLGFALAYEENGLIGDGTAAYDNETGLCFMLKQGAYAASKITGSGTGWGNGLSGGGGIVEEDLLKMIGTARYVRPGMGRFICSPEFYWTVMVPIIINKGGVTVQMAEDGPRFMFQGVQVMISYSMPRVSGSGQIACLYGDIGLSSTIGVRKVMTLAQSREVFFTSQEVAVLASSRMAQANHTLGDATTPGPVVGLYTG